MQPGSWLTPPGLTRKAGLASLRRWCRAREAPSQSMITRVPAPERINSDQAQTGRLRSLPTVDYVDRDLLALRQAGDPRAVQRRSVHKDVFAAPIRGDEAKSLHGVVPLDRTGLLDSGSDGRRIHGALRACASGLLFLRGAAVDTQDFSYLRSLGPRTSADFERRTGQDATVAAPLDYTHVQEGITGSIGKLNEAKALIEVVPFDDSLHRGTRGGLKPLGGKSRCSSETASGCFKVVVIERTATGRAKISVSAAHLLSLGSVVASNLK